MSDGDDRFDQSGGTELDLYIENGEVLVSGPTDSVLAYVEELRGSGAEVATTMLNGRRAADLAAVLTTVGAAKQAASGGVYLRVAEESVPHLIKNGLIPAKNGAHQFLGMTRSGSTISHHLRFTGKPVNPAQMLNVQMIAVQFALRMAIGEVVDAVKRVEGKVDAILQLAKAERTGNVLGLHQELTHYCQLLDESGVVTTSDWGSITSTGSQLTVAINQLRRHIATSLAEVVVSAPIPQRADAVSALTRTHRIDETLALLVVIEDAMFKFQQLRVAHVQRTESEFLESTVHSARQVLADNARLDEELFSTFHATLDAASVVRPLEIHRRLSIEKLTSSTDRMKGQLDEFARARRLQGAEWQNADLPTIGDAATEVRKRIHATGRRIDAAGNRVVDHGFSRLDSLGRALQDVASRRAEPQADAETDDAETAAAELEGGGNKPDDG